MTRAVRRSPRDESGSMVIMLGVLLVTTLLVTATLTETGFGLRVSRRYGDSANALQVADAGVNDAAQSVPLAAGSTFTRSGTVGNGAYTYTASHDTTDPRLWHVDSIGVDRSGVKRRIQADATGESQFTSPLYVNNLLIVGAGGLLDSFTSGQSSATGCTGKGYISVSDGNNVSFTSGGKGNANCTGRVIDPTWTWAMDGCVVFGGSNLPPTGQANCPPPPATSKTTKLFPLQKVNAPTSGVTYPSSGSVPGTSWTCNAGSGANALHRGGVYYYTTVTLAAGCGFDTTGFNSSNPARIYAKSVVVGSSAHGLVNAPTTATCPVSTAGWAYADANNNPPAYYCTGWPSMLQVFVPSGIGGSVSFQGSNTDFWGMVDAPDATVVLSSPQLEMWGAMVAGSVNVKSQFSWHFDETETSVTTGRYSIKNWREVHL